MKQSLWVSLHSGDFLNGDLADAFMHIKLHKYAFSVIKSVC
jgi:hypothetical protein